MSVSFWQTNAEWTCSLSEGSREGFAYGICVASFRSGVYNVFRPCPYLMTDSSHLSFSSHWPNSLLIRSLTSLSLPPPPTSLTMTSVLPGEAGTANAYAAIVADVTWTAGISSHSCLPIRRRTRKLGQSVVSRTSESRASAVSRREIGALSASQVSSCATVEQFRLTCTDRGLGTFDHNVHDLTHRESSPPRLAQRRSSQATVNGRTRPRSTGTRIQTRIARGGGE